VRKLTVITKTQTAVFVLIALVFLLARNFSLGKDLSNTDEARWQRRSIRFLDALKVGKLSDTYQHYQPGVTLMWMGAINFQLTKSWPQLENADYYPNINRNLQLILVSTLFFLFLYQIVLIWNIYDLKTAVIFGFFVATEPYLIGIDRWVHLTSLETYLSFSAFLTALLFVKNKRNFLLTISGVLLGLAVLTKLTSLITLPFIALYLLSTLRKNGIKPVLIISFSFIIAFLALFPAMWVQPIEVLQKLSNSITAAVNEDSRGVYFTGWRSIFYYLIILLYKLSPVTLITALVGFIVSLSQKHISTSKMPFLFFIYSLIILTIADKKIDRYVIFLFPALILVASTWIAHLENQKVYAIFLCQSAIFFFSVIKYFPVMSAYYSPVAGGEKQALKNGFYENSGEYFAQAAFYLNDKPRNEIVYIPNNYESFSYFHKGKKVREFGNEVSYVINSVDFDRPEPDNYGCSKIEKTFGPGDFKAVYIFSCMR
jgi:hypothetical protein